MRVCFVVILHFHKFQDIKFIFDMREYQVINLKFQKKVIICMYVRSHYLFK